MKTEFDFQSPENVMKRTGLIFIAILLMAFPMFSQNGNVADDRKIQYLDSEYQEIFLKTFSVQDSIFSVQDSILLDSVYYFEWDEAVNDWTSDCCFDEHSKTIYIYDENVNLILIVPYHGSEINGWRECSVRGYTYDENGNQTISAHFTLDETTQDWIGYLKREYGYDENGNKTFEIDYHWDKTTNDWIEYWKREYAYDGNNNRVLITNFQWETVEWREDWKIKYEYTYDENNNILTKDYYLDHDINDWLVIMRYEYAYDENGNRVLELTMDWNYSINEWEVNTKYEYEYDEYGKKNLQLKFHGDFGTKTEYFYDEYDNLIQRITFSRDEITEDWMAREKVEWYYSNHNQSTQISKYFQNDFLLKIYPNPTNSIITIETEYPDLYSIQIASLNGQLLLSKEFEGTTHQIDLSSFQKGVYLITIRSENFLITRKIVKL